MRMRAHMIGMRLSNRYERVLIQLPFALVRALDVGMKYF